MRQLTNTECEQEHRYEELFRSLPNDQGGAGRHKCAGCAYDRGFQHGLSQNESPQFDFDGLAESQAGAVRHKSPHAAWALGYLDGVQKSYE